MKLHFYRFLDSLQSFFRRKTKEIRLRHRWGEHWRDTSRIGRRYSRVEAGAEFDDGPGLSYIRPEPGWEWNCPNCREYSIITESMMPEIIAAWAADAKRITDLAASKGVKFTIKPKPTAATAGCTNCKYLPGEPE